MASAGERRRVLIVVQNLPVPFDRRVWLEATTLRQAGYAVSVICPKAKGFTSGYEVLEGVHIYRYPLPFEARGTVGFVAEFAWCLVCAFYESVRIEVRGQGFDVLHACNPPETYWLLGAFWRLFGKRFLFDHHDLSPEMYSAKFGRDSGPVYSALMFLERMTFRVAQTVIATNESHKGVAVTRGRVPPDMVYVVRSGPDLARFEIFPADSEWKKGKKYLLLYLGEMCAQDGVDHLVRAIRILRDELARQDFHCVFVGGGPHQAAIRDYAGREGVAELCTFTGRVSDELLCRILSSADVAVDPDPKTPWSDQSTMNKIMEYMYFGLPIVAYDLRETRYSAGNAAVYAQPNEERDLARCIAALMDAAGERAAMGESGRQRVREVLAWQYSVPHLLAAYESVFRDSGAARPRPPDGAERPPLASSISTS